ncbi:MAG: hypothetical protein KDB60_13200 [Propionibacteriaceae bacterium]|nr:hypothetical protein [Propionibacteriaceae bacterium]
MNYGPPQDSAGPLALLLGYGTIDPILVLAGAGLMGIVLTVIPRTRRTGIGVMAAVVLQSVVMVALVIWLLRALSHWTMF